MTYRNSLGVIGDLQYTYDSTGNPITASGTFANTLLPDTVLSAGYDAANRQLTLGNKEMTYDPNGNLTSLTETQGTSNFTWDVRNRLTAISGQALAASFRYDAFGRRTEKAVNGRFAQYQYDGFDIIQELSNGIGATYLRTLALDETLGRGATEFYLNDRLGSTLALTDPTGTVTTRYVYDPFGGTQTSGMESGNPFQYGGRENDLEDVYYYRSRYYAPSRYRYIAEDPFNLTLAQGLRQQSDDRVFGQFSYDLLLRQPALLNPYAYVQNNPLRFRDPYGLVKVVGGLGVSAVAIYGLEVSGGGYYDTTSGEAGLFGAGGAGVGLNGSVDVFGGVIWGELEGITANSNLVLGPVSLTFMYDPFAGEFVGFTAGIGPLIPGVPPFGYSETISVTEGVCLRKCPPPPPCLGCRK